jgi:hypothetical protein
MYDTAEIEGQALPTRPACARLGREPGVQLRYGRGDAEAAAGAEETVRLVVRGFWREAQWVCEVERDVGPERDWDWRLEFVGTAYDEGVPQLHLGPPGANEFVCSSVGFLAALLLWSLLSRGRFGFCLDSTSSKSVNSDI